MKPLKRMRPWVVPEGWGMVTAGLVGLAYTLVYPDDLGILATIAVWVVAAGAFYVVGVRLTFPEMNAARPVSPDVPVKPSKGPFVHWALMTGGLMAVSCLYVLLTDRTFSPFFPGMVLGSGLSHLVWGRRMATWEDEHGVELLGPWWQLRVKGLSVRPRQDSPPTTVGP